MTFLKESFIIVEPVFVLVVGLWRIPQACWEIISGMPVLLTGEAYWLVALAFLKSPDLSIFLLVATEKNVVMSCCKVWVPQRSV